MRLSAHQIRRRQYPQGHVAMFAEVFVNGERQELVTVADEALGVVERYACEADGRLRRHRNTVAREVVTGTVRITLREGAPETAVRAYERLRAREPRL